MIAAASAMTADGFESGWPARDATAPTPACSRRLRPRPASSDLVDLAGNDYLGLRRDPRVTAAAAEAAASGAPAQVRRDW